MTRAAVVLFARDLHAHWQSVARTGTDTRPNRTFTPIRQGRLRIHDPTSEQRQALAYVDLIRIEECVR